MSTALTVHAAALSGPVPPAIMADINAQSQILWNSGMCPKSFKNPEQAVISALYGREIGLSIVRSWKEIHVIDGVPSISTQLMNEKFRIGCPTGLLRIEQDDANTYCRISTKRTPSQEWWDETLYTWEEAKAARLTEKSNWKNAPRDMLYNRAFSRHARRFLTDVLAGLCYTPEELQGGVDTGFIDQRASMYDEEQTQENKPANPAPAPQGIPKKKPAPATTDPVVIDVQEAKAEPEQPTLSVEPKEDGQKVDKNALAKLNKDLQGCTNKNDVDIVWNDFRDAYSGQPATLMQGYTLQAQRLATF